MRTRQTTQAPAPRGGPTVGAWPLAVARAGGGAVTAAVPCPEIAVVARARADAQHHVAAWRTGYEDSLDVSLSWLHSSRELGIAAALRAQYTAALVVEARRLHVKLVVRASAAAVDWAHRDQAAPLEATREPARTWRASQWGIVAHEIGVEASNEVLRVAFERLVRVALAREAAYVAHTPPGARCEGLALEL